jgi:hypothetical protein
MRSCLINEGALILRSRTLAVGLYGKHSVRSRFEVRGRLVGEEFTHLRAAPLWKMLGISC